METEEARLVELNMVDALHVSTVLEDTVDQLVILGRVMPGTFRPAAPLSKIVTGEELDDSGVIPPDMSGGTEEAMRLKGYQTAQIGPAGDVGGAGGGLDVQQPGTGPLDNNEKLQIDRAFLEQVFQTTALELFHFSTFQSLLDAIAQQKELRQKLEHVIRKEAEGRRTTKRLQRELIDAKKQREAELQKLTEQMAHLKDQLQEMKAKTHLESKYVTKVTAITNTQTLKRLGAEETRLRNEIVELKLEIDEENRVNSEIESFLRKRIDERQEMLHFWADKYDTEVDMKQKEVDILKAARNADFDRLVELKKIFKEYEQVAVDDRRVKEKQTMKKEQDRLENECAIMIQAWWRGWMVRRCLGQYKPKKKKKGKGKGKDKK